MKLIIHNQVDPYGSRYASEGRSGTLTGNHLSKSAPRLCCSLDPAWYRKRAYQRLFFLDEATALSAGHRPCNRCRRDQKISFVSAWQSANGDQTMPQIDASIRRALLSRTTILNGSLPIGVMFETAPDASQPTAVRSSVEGGSLLWSPTGYSDFQPGDASVVSLLTPQPIVETFRAGYIPGLHPSAVALRGGL